MQQRLGQAQAIVGRAEPLESLARPERPSCRRRRGTRGPPAGPDAGFPRCRFAFVVWKNEGTYGRSNKRRAGRSARRLRSTPAADALTRHLAIAIPRGTAQRR